MKKIIFALLLTSNVAIAQNEIELDPITISATLNPTNSSRTGRNIITVPGSYFDKLPVSSLDELLRYVPGVEVQQRGPAGSQSDIVLRGGTFQQVLIILDCIRLNDPTTGHFNAYIPIAPSEIERIEVLKGASSAIYGFEAVGGVINIITKSFAAKRDQSKKELSLSAAAGEYDLFNVNAGGLYQNKNTVVSAGVLSNNSDGQLQRGTRGFFHNNTASLSFKQFIGKYFSVAARSSYDQRKFAAQNFYTSFVSDTANEKVTSNWNQFNLHYHKLKHDINFDAGYKSARDIYQFNPKSTPNNNRSSLLQFLLVDNFKPNPTTTISTGVQFQNRKIISNDRGDHKSSQFAAFLILNQKIKELTLSPSVRVDGSEFVPQLNLSYHLNKFQLRASAGKTIRDADFTERYNNYNKALVTGGSIGNPELKAERSFSYEAGADYFSGKFKFSLTGFQRRHSNLIDWMTTPYSQMPRKVNLSPTGTYALAQNIAKVKTTGIETDLQYTDKNFISTLGLVWLESKSSNGTPSFYISSHAKFLANFSAAYTGKRFFASATAIYKKSNPQKATAINAGVDAHCFMMNAKAGFTVIKHFSIFTEVDNIFDNRCGDLLGSQVPGRWFSAGISFTSGSRNGG